jgi:hypothetical protein
VVRVPKVPKDAPKVWLGYLKQFTAYEYFLRIALPPLAAVCAYKLTHLHTTSLSTYNTVALLHFQLTTLSHYFTFNLQHFLNLCTTSLLTYNTSPLLHFQLTTPPHYFNE